MRKMPVSVTQAEMWVLSADRQTVRFHIPPVRLAGRSEPLTVHLDCDGRRSTRPRSPTVRRGADPAGIVRGSGPVAARGPHTSLTRRSERRDDQDMGQYQGAPDHRLGEPLRKPELRSRSKVLCGANRPACDARPTTRCAHVAPCTPRTTSGATICSPPPISTKAFNPNTLGLVSGSHVPLTYPSQRISLVAICQPVGPVKVTDALATPKLPLSSKALLDAAVTTVASSL